MSRYVSESLRKFVAQRAQYCCEYCLLNESDAFFSHQIEHIIPRKHGGETHESNFAYACGDCNQNKGSNLATMLLPDRTLVPLFNPRENIWAENFSLSDCVFSPKSSVGEATIKVLKMNDVDKIIERRILDNLKNQK